EILDRLPREVANIDDPIIRSFLRLKIASFLWSTVGDDQAKAESLVTTALTDLENHHDELDPSYESLLRNELIALLALRSPEAARRYKSEAKNKELENSDDVAYSILTSKRGDNLAVQKVSEAINRGEPLTGSILFFLSELQKQQPALVPKLLNDIL